MVMGCFMYTQCIFVKVKSSKKSISTECVLQADVIHQLGEQIGTKLAKAEELGAEGNVESSLKYMEEVEELKKQKSQAEVHCTVLLELVLCA